MSFTSRSLGAGALTRATVAAFCFLALCSTPSAWGQSRDVAFTTIQSGSWRFVATTLNGQAETFVGFRDPNTAAGENIRSVWIRRKPGSGGEWESWAWEEPDQSKVVATISAILDLPSLCNPKWPVAPSYALTVAPFKFEKGVAEDDPFLFAIEIAEDPKEVVTALELLGLKAAWLDIFDLPCGYESVLNAWSDALARSGDVPSKFRLEAASALLASGCTTAKVQSYLSCWIDEFWLEFDQGRRIGFDGRGLGIHPDWHPLYSSVIPAYLELHPELAHGDLHTATGWAALPAQTREDFRQFSREHTFSSIWRPGPRTNPLPVPLPTPAPVPGGCDHAAFRQQLEALLQQQRMWDDAYNCLYQDEGYTDVILRCPQFDCDDFADTIGSCVRTRLQALGFEIQGRNVKVMIRKYTGPFYSTIGHAIFAVYYCGYWYLLDADVLIGIVPGSPNEVPLDQPSRDRLRDLAVPDQDDDVRVFPDGEWAPGTRPFWEGPPWFVSRSQALRVFQCLRSLGLTDAQILDLISCAVPAGSLPEVEDWLTNPNATQPPTIPDDPPCRCGNPLRPLF